MGIEAIDHLYVETRNFEDGLTFWQGLGFELLARWGADGHKAGRLKSGQAVIVLAESQEPKVVVHFRVAGEPKVGEGVEVLAPFAETHWGTRLMRVGDLDGHAYALEEVK